MSLQIELKVPDIGGSTDVEVVEVLVQPGDTVKVEQPLIVMESDKASMDVPSTAAGTIQEVMLKVGDKAAEGTLIATLLASEEQPDTTSKDEEAAPAEEPVAEAAEEETAAKQPAAPPAQPQPTDTLAIPALAAVTTGKAHATPSVRRFARELGVDLGKIQSGSGRKGRILTDDVKNFVKQVIVSGSELGGTGIPPIPAVDFSQFGVIEEQPLNKIKRLTGKGLSRAWLNLPMVTQHDEADITEMEAFRKAQNAELAKQGIKITPLVFIIKALLAAMKQFPQFNASLSPDGSHLIYKKYFNIGIAVDTPNGLVVPVIKNADQKSLLELVEELGVLSEKARKGKLMPRDMQGGCMSISSIGGIGGTAFTPIVNAPEVAILGVTRASMKPVWNGQEFIPRLILPLDLTYDHRVIDGADGARFVVAIANYLGDIRRLLL
jgi:pyruvate dehydrogenase E2 component (dihydrolipoyllysine-residue acetyltransferase)